MQEVHSVVAALHLLVLEVLLTATLALFAAGWILHTARHAANSGDGAQSTQPPNAPSRTDQPVETREGCAFTQPIRGLEHQTEKV